MLSSGNEIIDPQNEQSLRYGQVYDSNRASLLAALCENRYPSIDLGIAVDERDKLCQVVEAGLRDADILVTTGGVSMGEKDLFKTILEQDLKATIHFGRVLLKPG